MNTVIATLIWGLSWGVIAAEFQGGTPGSGVIIVDEKAGIIHSEKGAQTAKEFSWLNLGDPKSFINDIKNSPKR